MKLVEDLGRRVVAVQADMRDLAALEDAVATALGRLGRIDIVVANAGIGAFGPALEIGEAAWQEMIDINLTGVWKTVRAAVPPMAERPSTASLA